jgi:hypothetical protein
MLTLATPEVASVADTEAVTGLEMNQPFDPSGVGMVKVGEGATVSTWYEVLPVEEDRLPPPEAVAVKEADPVPSGRDSEQEVSEQVNAVPPMVPEMVRG